MTNNAPVLPYLLQNAEPHVVSGEALCEDVLTTQDPLPAVLEVDAAGLAIARATRMTEVLKETTDDK